MKSNRKLLKLYPWLTLRNRWDSKIINKKSCELDAMPHGWRKAFGDKMCEEIDNILKKANYQNDYRILEIKEKYGQLRWYTNSMPNEIFEEHENCIDRYTKLSEHTCIICGKSGKIDYEKFWLEPLCEKCRKEF